MKVCGLILFLIALVPAEARECFYQRQRFEEGEFFIETRFYPRPDSKKTIIIFPPTGGTNFIDRSYARFLCSEGFNVHILNRWYMDDEKKLDLDIHERTYSRAQKSVDVVIKNTPPDHTIGILGTSVGALHSATATGRVPRITHALYITGGADIAAIIVDSDQKAMQDARAERNKLFGFKTRDDYYNELRKHIFLDAIHYQGGFAGKKISMVISDIDTTVPGKNQRLLEKISSPKRVLELHDNHMWAIVKTWLFHKDFVLGSFQ